MAARHLAGCMWAAELTFDVEGPAWMHQLLEIGESNSCVRRSPGPARSTPLSRSGPPLLLFSSDNGVPEETGQDGIFPYPGRVLRAQQIPKFLCQAGERWEHIPLERHMHRGIFPYETQPPPHHLLPTLILQGCDKSRCVVMPLGVQNTCIDIWYVLFTAALADRLG